MSSLLTLLTFCTVLGCGLIAGVFFAFSSFVMPALGRLAPAQGIAAMQAINVAVIVLATASGCARSLAPDTSPHARMLASATTGQFACNWSGQNLEPRNTYHVAPKGADTNDGSSPDRAFKTLARAAAVAGPGDTVLAHDGTYAGEGDAVLSITRSGTASAPVTFKAAPGAHPVIENHAWNAVQIADASYVVVEGFEVIGENRAIDLDYARAHQTDRGERITNTIGIQVWNYQTGGRSHHVIVRNNRVGHFGGAGISGSECDCVTIADNVVYSSAWYSLYGGTGIMIWQPRNLMESAGYKLVIRGNRVFDIRNLVPWIDAHTMPEPLLGAGIMLDKFTTHGYTGPALVAANVSYRNQGCGFQAFETERTDFFDNISFRNLREAPLPWGELCDYDSHGSRWLRNVVVADPGSRATFVRRGPAPLFDGNLYWPEAAATATVGPRDRRAEPRFVDVSGSDTPGAFSERGWDFTLKPGSPTASAPTP